jgi:uncharacterized protein YggE
MSGCSDLRVWFVRLGILGLWVLAGPMPAQTPTQAQEGATPKPSSGGTIVISATARKRVPNTVADVIVGIEADGRDVATVAAACATFTGVA